MTHFEQLLDANQESVVNPIYDQIQAITREHAIWVQVYGQIGESVNEQVEDQVNYAIEEQIREGILDDPF